MQIDLVPRLFEAVGPRVDMHTVEALPLLGLPPVRLSPSARLVKRSIDIIVGRIALLLVCAALRLPRLARQARLPGPVFFRQTRLGLNMKEFTVLKFRTMYADTDDSAHREYVKGSLSWRVPAGNGGVYKPDMGAAVTPFGRRLRRTSLDELPQLINVLKGDMSLVGPRPCIPYETEHFAPHHFERFLVPAGLDRALAGGSTGQLELRRGPGDGRCLRPELVARSRPSAAVHDPSRSLRQTTSTT